ncbi:MAG: DUF4474 domain-containing protein [Tissierellia bacterium]|nr:DUF4474 domain-containing protein [Tissierellia bacterium]MDD4726892.1 DUF4474 domain-containing protein [Tissierellia bacterium]
MMELIMDNGLWIFLIIAIIALVITIIYKKLKSKTDYDTFRITDLESLNQFLEPYGYSYNPGDDLFYSNIDAWQRQMGYSRLYDESAAPMSMIIDCEPIYFKYDNKDWLIQLWKGQYGMTSGAEIGVYYTEKVYTNTDYFNWTLYECPDDDNLLVMKFSLLKNDKRFMSRNDKHWWLTGFKLGEFSQPWELRGIFSITLKDKSMLNAFLLGLKNAGYSKNEIYVVNRTVKILFDKPKTPQPFTRMDKFDEIAQKKNKLLCDKYNELTREYDNSLDKIIALQDLGPDLLESLVKMGKSIDVFKL